MARALIVGLGREGLALARYLRRQGQAVVVCDGRPAEALAADAAVVRSLGATLIAGDDCPALVDFDTLYLSPAVSKEAPVVLAARAYGLPVSSLTDLFFQICPAHIAGVTGSNGKTTTTTLLGRMVEAEGLVAHVGGNIGRPLLNEASSMAVSDWVVLEMSSFQLEWLGASPDLAVVTNLTPNHLDRHHGMEAYLEAKLHIVRAQRAGDTAVLNADDPYAPRFAQDAGGRVLYFSLASLPSDGAVLEGDMLCLRRGGYTLPVCTRRDLRVPGLHNVANALAAMAAAEVIGVEPEAMLQAVADFTGVPHRLELVRILDGVRYLNDSIATSPDRAGAALAAVEEPILLILGGHDKDLPWAAFSRSAVARCRGIFLIGEAQELIAEHLERAMNEAGDSLLRPSGLRRCGDLPQAVAQASEVARPGDVVLLSPACASYDQFQSFEARGARFRELVEALRGRS